MIFQDALKSIRKDFSKAFFYWLIFVLTTMFIYLFYNISMSDPSVNPLNDTGNMITYVMIMVIVLCSIDILFANDFYVKLKGKDLAVRLICGGKFYQIAGFLMIQTLLLLVLAFPLGVGLSYACIPLVNSVLSVSNHGFLVTTHPEAFLNATVIILYVIFWIIMLNMSFAYRNAVGLLMNPSTITSTRAEPYLRLPFVPKDVTKVFDAALFIVPIIIIYMNRNLAVIASIVGLVGLNGCFTNILIPWISKHISDRYMKDPIMVATMGFVRRDIIILKNNIFLFMASAIILVSMLVNSLDNDIAMMTILISYFMMTFLQALAMMFKLGTEVSLRDRLFRTLEHIGYMHTDQETIVKKEIKHVYGIVLVLTIFYIFNILTTYTLAGDLSWKTSLFLLAGAVVPLLICQLINLFLYRKAVFPKVEQVIAE
jgi:hypothetical protein